MEIIEVFAEGKRAIFKGYTKKKIKDFDKFPVAEYWLKRKGVKIDVEKHAVKISFHSNPKKIYFYPIEALKLTKQMELTDKEYYVS